jgi:uncharacterized protein (TIGR00255 family)
MAVYSMTGYASVASEASADHSALAVEARSVNGRFLDLSFRLSEELRSLEPTLRDLLTAALRRGKVEMRLGTAQNEADAWPQPAPEQLNRLAHLQNQVVGWLPDAPRLSVHEALHWCRNASPKNNLSILNERALEAAKRCVEGLVAARESEGAKLVLMLRQRTTRLRELAAQAAPMIPAVVQRQQQKFIERWEAALALAAAASPGGGTVPAEAARERALAEAATYALRIDVAEELSRLDAHITEIERLLKGGGELGKRLDFLIQELHREANTLGAKSSALELTAISVEMKVLIEQMREQVQNIE